MRKRIDHNMPPLNIDKAINNAINEGRVKTVKEIIDKCFPDYGYHEGWTALNHLRKNRAKYIRIDVVHSFCEITGITPNELFGIGIN